MNISDHKRRMDEYERYDTDGLKSSRTRDKYERSRVRRNKSDKDRSPVHSHRYIIFYLVFIHNFYKNL